jgi:hypothetical protein
MMFLSFLRQKKLCFFRSLSDCSMLCSFHFTYIHLNRPALIFSLLLLFFLCQQRRPIDFKLKFFLLLFTLMFLSLCHCLFFSSAYFFSPFLHTVCVRLFKTMIFFSEIMCFENDDLVKEYCHYIY